MASNPGAVFQDEIKASIPAKSGNRKPWIYKPPDVPQFGLRCRKCHRGVLKRQCTSCRRADDFDPRFTPKQPFDLEVCIPCSGAENMRGAVVPQIVFAFELKRTQGKIPARGPAELHARLSFSDVKDHQCSGLRSVAACGGVAGILWLVELPGIIIGQPDTGCACHFIPIHIWEERKAEAHMASMTLATARAVGIEVEQDVGRGRSRRYWKMAELFRHFSAAVEPTPHRKLKAPVAVETVRLFEEPKPNPVRLFEDPDDGINF